MRLAIIDLGSNSIRFDVYDITSETEFERIHREKQMVRLGDGVFTTGELDPAAIGRAMEALEDFSLQSQSFGVEKVHAFATAALRDSKDGEKFIRRVNRSTGIKMEIISGQREAELIAKGVLSNEKTPVGLFALVDIGGGSTEICICHKNTIVDSYSFHLGANRLEQTILKKSPPTGKAIAELREHVQKTLGAVVEKNNWPQMKSILGSSGTVRAVKRILKKKECKTEPIKTSDLTVLVKELSKMSEKELMAVPGMERKRVDLILSGSLLLQEISKTLGASNIFTTDYALRDGILEEILHEHLRKEIGPKKKSRAV